MDIREENRETLTARVRRGDLFAGEGNCRSRDVFSHVTSLWGVLCLIALRDGTQRYSELRRKTNGVSEKMLTQTLKQLEADGFVRRTAHPVMPPRVEYDLTELGQEVAAHVAALADILLLGTDEQVRLAAHAAGELAQGRPVHTDALVVSLRDFIRQALDLAPIPPGLVIPRQGPTRPAGGAAKGRKEEGDAKGGKGGGGGGMGAMGGGMGAGMALGARGGEDHERDA